MTKSGAPYAASPRLFYALRDILSPKKQQFVAIIPVVFSSKLSCLQLFSDKSIMSASIVLF